jgi:UDP-N-acetylglucosamine 2-epimerase (non-hydrolysing)
VSKKVKILIVFGTRPEAIKMAPVVAAFKATPDSFDTKVCTTGQHREMLQQVLDFFNILPDYELGVMKPGQSLFELSANVLLRMQQVLEVEKPEFVFVHGDTTTSTMAALAAFYMQIKVCHVEAGLRTFNKWAPFPEEMNRVLTARLADVHFAPTLTSKNNLLNEQIPEDAIVVTGNTVIDALLYSVKKVNEEQSAKQQELRQIINFQKRIILVTGHRRENFGDGFEQICRALSAIAQEQDVEIVYPVHLNPNVQEPVRRILSGISNVHLIEPLAYADFVWLMDKAHIVITDSGGIQEEAPSLGKPVLVMRDTTERPEAVDAGTVLLVGTDKDKIVQNTLLLLRNDNAYNKMSKAHNPYGDGLAAGRIIAHMKKITVQST